MLTVQPTFGFATGPLLSRLRSNVAAKTEQISSMVAVGDPFDDQRALWRVPRPARRRALWEIRLSTADAAVSHLSTRNSCGAAGFEPTVLRRSPSMDPG